VGVLLMMLSVTAMQECDVAIYVPANLCFQLSLNVAFDFMVWGVADQLENMVAYVMAFVVCLFAVYVSAPGADVGATLAQRSEINNAKMSQSEAKSRFGHAMVDLMDSWQNLQSFPTEATETNQLRSDRVKLFVERGLEQKIFNEAEIAELVRVLFRRTHVHSAPHKAVVKWMNNIDFFKATTRRTQRSPSGLETLQLARTRLKVGIAVSARPPRSPLSRCPSWTRKRIRKRCEQSPGPDSMLIF
jgi:hypothetical protein